MVRMLILILLGVFLVGITCLGAEMDLKVKYLAGVEHFKQSTIRLKGAQTVYFDPYRVEGEPHDADVVFISHPHGDHLSVADLKKVMKPSAIIVVVADGLEKLPKIDFPNVVTVVPDKEYTVAGLKFQTVPAYNIDKTFHTKDKNWVGYIVRFNDIRYYFAGDTDFIPEMKSFQADVAFLPIGGKYTMTWEEAAKAANAIKPKIAVPIHFGDVVGTPEDAQKFVAALEAPIAGIILKK